MDLTNLIVRSARVSKCHRLTVVRPLKVFLSLRKILRVVFANHFFFCILITYFQFFLHNLHLLCDFRCDFCNFSCTKFSNWSFDRAKKVLAKFLKIFLGWFNKKKKKSALESLLIKQKYQNKSFISVGLNHDCLHMEKGKISVFKHLHCIYNVLIHVGFWYFLMPDFYDA